ncbi:MULTISPECIES: C39 family peptidase [Clostridia]|jgi:uncharacterized protein YvpB|uniref:C39 family peptidase n=1 Tax=Clostridia TaxID=186801 RepID=UPI000E5CBFDF|nr:C39 family peptidase [Eubacterium sp. AF22-9]RGS30957.1 hypothetical protein DWY02_08525 [Eubacterium sp. AF22-9]
MNARTAVRRYNKQAARRQMAVTKILIAATFGMIILVVVVIFMNYKEGYYDGIKSVISLKASNDEIDYNEDTALFDVELDQVEESGEIAELGTENVQMQTETIENYYKMEDFEWLSQNPELPTGCEITSLTSVLNYYGINVKKETMADDYLKKGDGSYYKMFLGNPRDAGSFGCMAQPIVDAANLYFKKNNVSMKASNVSGVTFDKILEYVSQGVPMIVWNTMGMAPAYESQTLTLDGREYTWIAPEHCVVVVGYDLDNNEVYVADPMAGMVTRNLKTFEERYDSLKRQAVYVTI